MKRVSPGRVAEREVWAKAAGRCTLCARYLFGETPSYGAVPVGQVAHQVGATDGPKSPRGDSPLTNVERADQSNLMLLCQPCHRMIDEEPDFYPVEWLARQKEAFETRVRQATRFPTLEPTAVIEFTAPIRGNAVTIPREQIFEALREASLRFAGDHYRDATLEVPLTLPESTVGAWAAGEASISHVLERLPRMMADVGAESVSVFALGPVPFLIRLGAELGNKAAVHVFEPHRGDARGRWRWPTNPAQPVEFAVDTSEHDSNTEDVLVTVSLTAHVQLGRLPSEVAAMPHVSLSVVGDPKPGIIDSPAALGNFSKAWRVLLQQVERSYPSAKRIHLVAAVGCAAAIEVGRWRMRDAHPAFVLYQLTENQSYDNVLTLA